MTPDEEIRSIREELTRRGVLKVSMGDAFTRGALDGVSFGFADEVAGAFQGDGARDRMREELRLAQRDRPVTTFAGSLSGGLAPGFGVARGVASGARALGVGSRAGSYLGGATIGGAYGAGSGTTPMNRASGAALGAALGAGGTAVGEGLGYGAAVLTGARIPSIQAARLARSTLTRAQATESDYARRLAAGGAKPGAAKKQARAASDAGTLPKFEEDDLIRRANALKASGGVMEERVLDVGPFKADARAVWSMNTPGKSIVDNVLEQRRSTVTPSVIGAAAKAFRPTQVRSPGAGGRRGRAKSIQEAPPPSGYEEFLSAIEVARKGQTAPAYRELYAQKMPQDIQANFAQRFAGGGLKKKSRDAAMAEAESDIVELEDALTAARLNGAAQETLESISQDLADAQLAQKVFAEIEQGIVPQAINTRAVDLYQRGLRRLIQANELNTGVRERFLNFADAAIKGFADVRGITRRAHDLKEIAKEAKGFFTLKETEQNDLLRRATSTEQRNAVMIGVMEAFEDRIAQGDARAVLAITRKPAFIDSLQKTSASPALAKRLVQIIERKAGQQFNDNSIRGGSTTAPTQEAIRSLTDDADEAGIGALVDFIQAGGDPKVLGLKWLGNLWDQVKRPGIRNPDVAREYARILTEQMTPQKMQQLAARLKAAQAQSVFKPAAIGAARAAGVGGATAASRPVG